MSPTVERGEVRCFRNYMVNIKQLKITLNTITDYRNASKAVKVNINNYLKYLKPVSNPNTSS